MSGSAVGGTASGGAASGGAASGGTGTGGAATGGGAGETNTAGTSSGGTAGTGGAAGGPVFHIFMLMGQSNMAGVAKAEASDQNTDERLRVWGGCNQKAEQWNLANPPLSDCPGESGINLSTSVDPGIWFAKTLLKKLPAGDTVGLVVSLRSRFGGADGHALR